MNQQERRLFLIKALLREQGEYADTEIPTDEQEQKKFLRALMNVRMPKPISEVFLHIQDEYLQEETASKGITDIANLTPILDGLYLWKGDITTLRCDAIVNAANSGLTGCYYPLHACIDNQIHTFAGVQLRRVCSELMKKQGYSEDTGMAKITPAYNLPCNYILHTVGPIINGNVTKDDESALASCYRSCLELSDMYNIKSIAFCCISTGEFHFPNQAAAEIAVKTVKLYKATTKSKIEVIFNVFKDIDYEIYRSLLR